MHFIKSFVHWWRVTFSGACSDPKCPGTMQIYDNNVMRDWCSVCGRTERMYEEGVLPGRGSKERGYPADNDNGEASGTSSDKPAGC